MTPDTPPPGGYRRSGVPQTQEDGAHGADIDITPHDIYEMINSPRAPTACYPTEGLRCRR